MTVSAPQLGKTFYGCVWILAAAWQAPSPIHPYWWAAPTYRQAEHAQRIFIHMARSSGILRSWKSSPHMSATLINNALIEWRSWERPDGLWGPTVKGIVVDEFGQLDWDAYRALISRVSETNGFIRYEGNVGDLGGPAETLWNMGTAGAPDFAARKWTWRDRAEAFVCMCPQVSILPIELGTGDLHLASCGRGGYIRFVEDKKRTMPGTMFRQLYEAEWIDWNLLPVYTFDRERHLDADLELDPHLPLGLSCDFNVNPLCWEIGQHHMGHVWWVDELALGDGATTARACREFCERYDFWKGPIIIYGDASGKARKTSADDTDYAIMRRVLAEQFGERALEFRVPPSNPSVKARVNAMNARLLAADQETVSMWVHPRCARLTADLARVSWADKNGNEIDKNSNKELTHASDAAGYMVAWEYPVVETGPSMVHDDAYEREAFSDPILSTRF